MRVSFLVVLFLSTASSAHAQGDWFTIVFLNKKKDAAPITKSESESIMKGHMASMDALAKQGKLLAAGPFDGGGGIFIMSSISAEEVTQWISADPGVKAKRWNIEILPYQPRHGGVCPVQAPYEMTNYTFVRFNSILNKSTATNYMEIIDQHNRYVKEIVKTGNVITEAVFGERDGGILVLKGDVQPAVIESDPGVQQGLIDFEIKKLFIAKGSFCEP